MPFFHGFPKNYKDRPLLFVDLEMTGLDVGKHEIIEMAALLVDQFDYGIKNSFYTKVSPTHIETADPKALRVVGYDPSEWQQAVPLRQALMELARFAPNCFLAGFSVQNDWNFLIFALEKEKLPYFFDNYLIEVWTLAYVKYHNRAEVTNIGIGNLCKMLGIPIQLHKPDSDVRATYEIFRRLVNV